MKKKIYSVVGARPQFIKCAALSPVLRKYFDETIIHTGQHYDYEMSQSFFEELKIPSPDFNLCVGSGRPGWQIAQIIIPLEELVCNSVPDAILVFGDTNSTAASSIVAVKHGIKLIHIEAGLREFNKYLPEESNKLITDILSDIFFCPTQTGVENLKKMGIEKNVFNVGDVTIDLIKTHIKKIKNNNKLLEKHNIKSKKYYFLTCHRAANTDDKTNLEQILSAATELDFPVLFPIHPRTKKSIEEFGLSHLLNKNIVAINPIGYFDTQTIIINSNAVITDSGGIIKEAYFHRVPGIIIDTQTEWVETVAEGWNFVAGPNKKQITGRIKNLSIPEKHSNAVGSGNSSDDIAEILKNLI